MSMPKDIHSFIYHIPQPTPPAPSPYDLETPEKRAHDRLVNAIAGKVWMLNALPDSILLEIDRLITAGHALAKGNA